MRTVRLVWVRVGESGEYESFDDLDGAIGYLNDIGVGNVMRWVRGGHGVGIETVNYWGHDFVTLFWGDSHGSLRRRLDAEERSEVVGRLCEVYI